MSALLTQPATGPNPLPDSKPRRPRAGTKARRMYDLARETSADVAQIFHDAGGRYDTACDWRPWTIETAAGTLGACDPDFDLYAECGAFLHMRFEEPKRAAALLDPRALDHRSFTRELNPFSGKWNIHAHAPGLLAELRRRLALVVPS